MTRKECAERKERQLRAAPGDALSVGQKEGEESAKENENEQLKWLEENQESFWCLEANWKTYLKKERLLTFPYTVEY